MFVHGDVTDPLFLEELFTFYGRIDFVYHLSGHSEGTLSHHVRAHTYRDGVVGSAELLNAAVNHKVKCFVFASSTSVYGTGYKDPVTESTTPRPEDPAAIAKYVFELDLLAAKDAFGISFVVHRLHDVYGPRQSTRGNPASNIVAHMLWQRRQKESITIPGDGSMGRAFTYVGDVAPFIVASATLGAAKNQVFNTGTNAYTTFSDLAQKIFYVTSRDESSGPPEQTARVNHDKFVKIFKPPQQVSLVDGLKLTDAAKSVRPRLPELLSPDALGGVEIKQGLPPLWKPENVAELERVDYKAGEVKWQNNVPASNQVEGDPGPRIPDHAKVVYDHSVNKRIKNSVRPLKWRQPGDSLGDDAARRPKTLVSIHTAVSYWHITELLLTSLATNTDIFDVILVDDHSDTVDVQAKAKEIGVKILPITGTKAEGHTHTLNVAWQYFMDHPEYDKLIMCNNDVLMPTGTVRKLSAALDGGWAWVMPMTSQRGTKHALHRLQDYYTVNQADGCGSTEVPCPMMPLREHGLAVLCQPLMANSVVYAPAWADTFFSDSLS